MPRLHPRTGALLPEVLSPAGSPECLPAAVAGGADAVFLGLRHFNARGRAENFRKAELAAHVRYLHEHGVKCYLVMNTLVHDDEFAKAIDLAQCAADAGVDAAIIQDLGLWSLLARRVPQLERHASTQMTIHDPSQVRVLAELGAKRVILARELSLAEVAACTTTARELGIETEHFVHGALCYAFSGQCLMSNFAGCRSANRGTCAQNCRFDYHRDGAAEVTTEISMRDLSLATRVAELAKIGVASLKIEGRLKGPDYVYTTARIYRAAVDAWATGKPLDAAWVRDAQRDVFSRANTAAPLEGIYDRRSRLHRYDPAADQQPDAVIMRIDRTKGEALLQARQITAGQGFAFTIGDFNGGFLVIAADAERGGKQLWRCRIRIAPHGPRIAEGTKLFRNTDHARKQEAAAAMATVPLPRQIADTRGVRLTVRAVVGESLHITATTDDGRSITVTGADPLPAASGVPLDGATLADKLAAFGGTAWRCDHFTAEVQGSPFCPGSVLKELRRSVVTALDGLPAMANTEASDDADDAPVDAPADASPAVVSSTRTTRLWVAVNSLAAGRAALAAGADAVWLDDPCADWWADAPAMIDRSGFSAHQLWLRLPATAPVPPQLSRLNLPVVAGHLGQLAAARAAGLPAIADVFTNTFSVETAAALHALGASTAVISLELSGREIGRLARRCATASMAMPGLALVAAGRVPSMLTRQDHRLTLGATSTIQATGADGGLPYVLQRRRHDTVVWEGRQVSCPDTVAQTRGLVDAWIIEAADRAPAAVTAITQRYRQMLDGEIRAEAVAEADAAEATHGTFTGHLHRGSRELDLIVSEGR